MKKPFRNGIVPQMISLQCLAPFFAHNSAARAVMHASHISQKLVINGGEEKYIQTGHEVDFGKYTFKVKMPCSGRIIKIIPRYPEGGDVNSLKFNPETLIIYEREGDKKIGSFSIPYHFTNAQYFGFKYNVKPTVNKLRVGAFIEEGTIFADSPSIKDNGGYAYGINANVAFVSIPGTSEDGIVISREFLERLKFRIYDTRIIEFGSKSFPLNLYGKKPGEYLVMPEIGDMISRHVPLMVLRDYDSVLGGLKMSTKAVTEVDYVFDNKVFARPGYGKVVDIKVIKNPSVARSLPEAMCAQLDKYALALHTYHRNIIQTEEEERRKAIRTYGSDRLDLEPEFHALIVEAMGLTNHQVPGVKQNINLLHRRDPVDEYRVEIVIEYEVTPGIGNKLTDQNGGKGVICQIKPRSEMPTDMDGNVADVCVDDKSVISRMNLGRLFEPYWAGSCRDVKKRIHAMVGVPAKSPASMYESIPFDKVVEANRYLWDFYRVCCPHQADFLEYQCTPEEQREFLISHVLQPDIHSIQLPIASQVDKIQASIQLRDKFPSCYGPVTYIGESGRRVTTVKKVRIAPLYMMLLEKTADSYAATSFAKLQHHGFVSPITKSGKFQIPYRGSPTRFLGATEARIIACYCDPHVAAELHDRSNSPETQRIMAANLMDAEKPTNVHNLVDRKLHPYGTDRAIQLIRHMFACQGIELVYTPENREILEVA